jgi:hypothetical protein
MSTLTGTTLYLKQTAVSTFQYSTNNSTWLSTSFPITLGTADATLTFVTDLSFTTVNLATHYFVLGQNGQTIDGNYKTVTISSTNNGFRGLVRNSAKSNTTLKNIKVNVTGTSKLVCYAATSSNNNTTSEKKGTGWIAQNDYGFGATNNSITNCRVDSPYGTGDGQNGSNYTTIWYNSAGTLQSTTNTGYSRGGMIVGDGATVNIDKCIAFSSNGGTDGGGIIGADASGCIVTNCYSDIEVGHQAGGIIGPRAKWCTIQLCYSYARINSNGGGGIVGYSSTNTTVTKCYTTTFPSGNKTSVSQSIGGICGNSCSSITVSNCYSNTAGSSLGRYNAGIVAYSGSPTMVITNCYSTGTYNTSSAFNYPIAQQGTITNCYGANGTWVDATANSSLITNTGIWTDVSLNSTSVPWTLSDFSYNFYGSSSGTNVTTQSVSSLTDFYYVATYTYSIISISVNSGTAVATYSGISINSSTGALSFSGLSVGT